MKQLSTYEELERRGLLHGVTDENAIREKLNKEQISFYIGFDPTSDSLHIGSLVPIMGMAFLQRHGHKPVALVGGATGLIGDPSGRDSERELMTEELARSNADSIRKQLERFLSFDGKNAAVMVNNLDWWGGMGYIDCLREIGKYFSVNAMTAKESVRRRLEDRDHGISYTEFSYQILQAHDFNHLYAEHGCTLQAGGSDQWGNITAGIDLIRRFHGVQAYGLTFPLVTTSSGEKFGKSAGNAIWLSSERTSPYQFYQYFVQTDDRDVENYLKFFTFLHPDEIDSLCARHVKEPHKREAQKVLAAEVTRVVHGQGTLDNVIKATQVLFGGEIDGLNDAELLDIFNDVPSTALDRGRLKTGISLIDLMAETELSKSKGEARRLLKGGGVYVNNRNVNDMEAELGEADLASESVLVLRSGKKRYHLVRFQ